MSLLTFLTKISYVYKNSSEMKIRILSSILLMAAGISVLNAQENPVAEVYLITCAPGTATYSIYGHSALRIILPEKNEDLVYNWGVFDFSAPNFVWKFAKGRLDYILAATSFDRFLQEYLSEERAVWQQRINLEPYETELLLGLIAENLKPENVKYRYDFFYDDCSTRIRDLLEKSIGNKLLYPPEQKINQRTFREKVGEYQRPYQWLQAGINLIMGTPADKKASFRDVMFLPIDMKKGLSEAVVNRSGKLIPLLRNPETLLSFPPLVVKQNFLTSPLFIFSIIVITIILLSSLIRNARMIHILDITVFSFFSLLAILIFFFSFFTDHQQMKLNLNILWLSPFLLFCLYDLIMKKGKSIWYKLVFFLSVIFLAIFTVFPGGFNNAFLPLLILIILRSAARADFSWNPMKAPAF
jgi:hypothetical protein